MIFLRHLSNYIEWLADDNKHSEITNIIIFLATIMFVITVATTIFVFYRWFRKPASNYALYNIRQSIFSVFMHSFSICTLL